MKFHNGNILVKYQIKSHKMIFKQKLYLKNFNAFLFLILFLNLALIMNKIKNYKKSRIKNLIFNKISLKILKKLQLFYHIKFL